MEAIGSRDAKLVQGLELLESPCLTPNTVQMLPRAHDKNGVQAAYLSHPLLTPAPCRVIGHSSSPITPITSNYFIDAKRRYQEQSRLASSGVSKVRRTEKTKLESYAEISLQALPYLLQLG